MIEFFKILNIFLSKFCIFKCSSISISLIFDPIKELYLISMSLGGIQRLTIEVLLNEFGPIS